MKKFKIFDPVREKAPNKENLVEWAQQEVAPFLRGCRRTVNWIVDQLGKVGIDKSDKWDYAENKILEGAGISITKNTGVDAEGDTYKTLTIEATGGPGSDDHEVKADSADTGHGSLDDKLKMGTHISKSVVTDAGVKKVQLDVSWPTVPTASTEDPLPDGVADPGETSSNEYAAKRHVHPLPAQEMSALYCWEGSNAEDPDVYWVDGHPGVTDLQKVEPLDDSEYLAPLTSDEVESSCFVNLFTADGYPGRVSWPAVDATLTVRAKIASPVAGTYTLTARLWRAPDIGDPYTWTGYNLDPGDNYVTPQTITGSWATYTFTLPTSSEVGSANDRLVLDFKCIGPVSVTPGTLVLGAGPNSINYTSLSIPPSPFNRTYYVHSDDTIATDEPVASGELSAPIAGTSFVIACITDGGDPNLVSWSNEEVTVTVWAKMSSIDASQVNIFPPYLLRVSADGMTVVDTYTTAGEIYYGLSAAWAEYSFTLTAATLTGSPSDRLIAVFYAVAEVPGLVTDETFHIGAGPVSSNFSRIETGLDASPPSDASLRRNADRDRPSSEISVTGTSMTFPDMATLPFDPGSALWQDSDWTVELWAKTNGGTVTLKASVYRVDENLANPTTIFSNITIGVVTSEEYEKFSLSGPVSATVGALSDRLLLSLTATSAMSQTLTVGCGQSYPSRILLPVMGDGSDTWKVKPDSASPPGYLVDTIASSNGSIGVGVTNGKLDLSVLIAASAHAASHTTGSDQISNATPTVHGLMSSQDKGKEDAQTNPHGWPVDNTGARAVTLSYDAGTRKVTITAVSGGSFDVWVRGVRHTEASPFVSAAHDATEGVWFFYWDGSAWAWSQTFWNLYTVAPAAGVYWSSVGATGAGYNELHGWDRSIGWHREQHKTDGTRLASGGVLSGYTLDTGTDAACKFAISECVIEDEDIEHTLAVFAFDTNFTIWRRSGTSGYWTWSTGNDLPFLYSTYPQRNYDAGGGTGWTMADISGTGQGEWVTAYVLATPALDATNHRFIIVPGQTAYTSLAAAQAELFSSLSLGTSPFQEFIAIAQLVYHARSTHGGTAKAQLESVARLTGSRGSSSSSSQNITHNSLSGLQGGATGEYYHLTATQAAAISPAMIEYLATVLG